MLIHALHGFLGLPEDWSFLSKRLPATDVVDSRNLWDDLRALPEDGNAFELWSEGFIDQVMSRRATREPQALIGYSMGGRLAMHAAIKAPDLFSRLILVSAHPGLEGDGDRPGRLANDQRWGARFLSEPWEEVLNDWSAQPVLQSSSSTLAALASSSIELARHEADFDRRLLARALDQWSLARQRDLRAGLRVIDVPTLFVCGERDTKFTALMHGLELGPRQELKIIPGAGHRVPWDQPDAFAEGVRSFLE